MFLELALWNPLSYSHYGKTKYIWPSTFFWDHINKIAIAEYNPPRVIPNYGPHAQIG